MKEEVQTTEPKQQNTKSNCKPAVTTYLSEVQSQNVTRTKTGVEELDRVLGGGIIPGSLILLGGEPGIGKSTLALQIALIVPNTLYISGEESVGQIKMRANRLQLIPTQQGTGSRLYVGTTSTTYNLQLANETNIDTICATIAQAKSTLAVIDSVQTIHSDDVAGEPGNVTQIRACTVKILETAKTNNVAVILIGHVTKDGEVAGPKTLEHLVDTVLYFEGERYHTFRILRATKNRFGPTDEVGIFEMKDDGLHEVKNPSAALLAERGENMPGSIVTCLMEGTRPLLVEIQALVNKTSFGYPVRKTSGFDLNRLHVLVAVLQKRAGLNLAQYDIHLNVVGGLNANEPAADLAVCLAIASAYKDKALGADLCVFGEVGLGGEVRSVPHTERRIKECEKLGMKRVISHEKFKNIGELIKNT